MNKTANQSSNNGVAISALCSCRSLHEILLREVDASPQDSEFAEIWSGINRKHQKAILDTAELLKSRAPHAGRSFPIYVGFDTRLKSQYLAIFGLTSLHSQYTLVITSPLALMATHGPFAMSECFRSIWNLLESNAVLGGLKLHNYLETRALAEVNWKGRRDG